MLLMRYYLKYKDTNRFLKWKNIFHANTHHKKAFMALTMSDKLDINIKCITEV